MLTASDAVPFHFGFLSAAGPWQVKLHLLSRAGQRPVLLWPMFWGGSHRGLWECTSVRQSLDLRLLCVRICVHLSIGSKHPTSGLTSSSAAAAGGCCGTQCWAATKLWGATHATLALHPLKGSPCCLSPASSLEPSDPGTSCHTRPH